MRRFITLVAGTLALGGAVDEPVWLWHLQRAPSVVPCA
jgi:hypothetical protein